MYRSDNVKVFSWKYYSSMGIVCSVANLGFSESVHGRHNINWFAVQGHRQGVALCIKQPLYTYHTVMPGVYMYISKELCFFLLKSFLVYSLNCLFILFVKVDYKKNDRKEHLNLWPNPHKPILEIKDYFRICDLSSLPQSNKVIKSWVGNLL